MFLGQYLLQYHQSQNPLWLLLLCYPMILYIKNLLKGTTILGGGDTASAAINLGYKEFMTHISTGGGASLEMLDDYSFFAIQWFCT